MISTEQIQLIEWSENHVLSAFIHNGDVLMRIMLVAFWSKNNNFNTYFPPKGLIDIWSDNKG